MPLAFLAYCHAAPCRLVSRFFPTGASICIASRSVPLERIRTRRSLGLRVSLSAEHLTMRRTACPNGYPRKGIRPIRPASEGCNPLCTEVRRVRFSFQSAWHMIGSSYCVCRRVTPKSPQYFEVHQILQSKPAKSSKAMRGHTASRANQEENYPLHPASVSSAIIDGAALAAVSVCGRGGIGRRTRFRSWRGNP